MDNDVFPLSSTLENERVRRSSPRGPNGALATFSNWVSCWSVQLARNAAEKAEPKKMNHDEESRLSLTQLAHDILKEGQVHLMLQPKINLATGLVSGFEALARVKLHDERITPDRFCPAMEVSGKDSNFDWMVLREAFALAAQVPQDIREKAPISVNVNPSTVATEGFGDDLINLARTHKVDLKNIKIELLEKAQLDTRSSSPLADEMRTIRRSGAHFSLDDFATGDSGPELLGLPVNEIKIDAYYVRGLMKPSESRKCLFWIQRMVSLAKARGLHVCAEGIEHPEQALVMSKLGVEYAQGYLWSKPLDPQAAFERAQLDHASPEAQQELKSDVTTADATAGHKTAAHALTKSDLETASLQSSPSSQSSQSSPLSSAASSSPSDHFHPSRIIIPPVDLARHHGVDPVRRKQGLMTHEVTTSLNGVVTTDTQSMMISEQPDTSHFKPRAIRDQLQRRRETLDQLKTGPSQPAADIAFNTEGKITKHSIFKRSRSM